METPLSGAFRPLDVEMISREPARHCDQGREQHQGQIWPEMKHCLMAMHMRKRIGQKRVEQPILRWQTHHYAADNGQQRENF